MNAQLMDIPTYEQAPRILLHSKVQHMFMGLFQCTAELVYFLSPQQCNIQVNHLCTVHIDADPMLLCGSVEGMLHSIVGTGKKSLLTVFGISFAEESFFG